MDFLYSKSNVASHSACKDKNLFKEIENKVDSTPGKHLKVIKFTGNMKENIDDLLNTIDCKCGLKKDIYQIMKAYGQKIVKLRQERTKQKELFNTEKQKNEKLQQQLKKTVKELKLMQQNYYMIRKDYLSRIQYDKAMEQNSELRQQLNNLTIQKERLLENYKILQNQLNELNQIITNQKKKNSIDYFKNNQSFLLDDSKYGQKSLFQIQKENQILKSKLDFYQNIYYQFPFGKQQILKILRQYAQQTPSFSTPQQRELYWMASRMNNNVWKKKLQIQIKDLHQRKENLRKLEQELKYK